MGYSRNFGSLFPEQTIELGTHKDVDDSVVRIVNQYNVCVQDNDMVGAASILEANREVLEPYILTMKDINRLEEEIYNTGLYAMLNNSGGTIISTTEPQVDQNIGDYWLSDY